MDSSFKVSDKIPGFTRSEMEPLKPIQPLDRAERSSLVEGSGGVGRADFGGELSKALGTVDELQLNADKEATALAKGSGNLHEVSIALEKADVSLRLMMKVRNKVVEAYQEVMRMSV